MEKRRFSQSTASQDADLQPPPKCPRTTRNRVPRRQGPIIPFPIDSSPLPRPHLHLGTTSPEPNLNPEHQESLATEPFNLDLLLKPLDAEQTSLFLSLGTLTSWSAERISIFLTDHLNVTIGALEIWEFYRLWAEIRSERPSSPSMRQREDEQMKGYLRLYDIPCKCPGWRIKGLGETERPVVVPFIAKWCPQDTMTSAESICPGFTHLNRHMGREYLVNAPISDYATPTPTEEICLLQFGPIIQTLVKYSLQLWLESAMKLFGESHPLRQAKEKPHVTLIMDCIGLFRKEYEEIFGMVESSRVASEDVRRAWRERRAGGVETAVDGEEGDEGVRRDTVYIRSTGYGLKVLVALMMADRVCALDRIRDRERNRLCFESVEAGCDEDGIWVGGLEGETGVCPICLERLGCVTEAGVVEQGIRLICCCWQVLGEECLRAWVREGGGARTCPCCRARFTKSFVEKLCGTMESKDLSVAEDEDSFVESSSDDSAGEEEDDAVDEDIEGGLVYTSSTSTSTSTSSSWARMDIMGNEDVILIEMEGSVSAAPDP